MNQDSLSHIVNQNEQLNADVVIDLVQLCQSFPYFSLPYVLLSKHYALKHDFRTENTLFQAALRVSDRDWMFQYIHKTNSLLAENQNQVVPENIEIESEPNATYLKSDNSTVAEEIQNPTVDSTEETNSSIQITVEPQIELETKSTFELAIDTLNAAIDSDLESETLDFPETIESEETLQSDLKVEGELFKITETIYELTEKEEVQAKILPELETNDVEFNKEPESMLFIPSIEAEPEIEITDLEVEKTTRTWLFDPETDSSVENEVSEELKDTANSEPIQTKPEPFKGLKYGAAYNIEDYFKIENPEPIETEKPQFEPEVQNNDFFAWLNSGLSNQGPINKPKEVSKSVLIDKFIQENPSIQRPKQEFFSPEKAMKKSEVLDMNLATETLAKIYMMQGYPEKAIKVYNQLQLKFPEKLSYFASLINKIKQENNL